MILVQNNIKVGVKIPVIQAVYANPDITIQPFDKVLYAEFLALNPRLYYSAPGNVGSIEITGDLTTTNIGDCMEWGVLLQKHQL